MSGGMGGGAEPASEFPIVLGDTTIAAGSTNTSINELTLTDLVRIQRELGSTLGTTGTIDLDFITHELQLMPAMTGAVVFTGSNYLAGATKTIRIIGGSSAYGFTFPTGWKFVNEAPTDLAIGKYAVLTLTNTTNLEGGVVAAYAVEA